MSALKVVQRPIDEIKPYEKNPRQNDGAIDAVAASIRQFGFRQPIVVDADGVIICGHTRFKAARKLGLAAPTRSTRQPPQAPTFYAFLVGAQHAGPGANACRTSCPDCLRDFSNLPYHAILDWRLGLDIARLALDPGAPIDFTVPYWQGLDAAVASPYFAARPGWQQMTIAGLQAGRRGNVVEIITHPLWDCDPNRFGPQLAAAHAQAIAGGNQVRFKSLFEVLRRPF
jgi:hypothetical protein